MTDGDLIIVGGETADECRRRVTVDQDEIRFDFLHDGIESLKTACRDIDQCLPCFHDVQVVIGRNLKQLQDLIEHLPVLGRDGDMDIKRRIVF